MKKKKKVVKDVYPAGHNEMVIDHRSKIVSSLALYQI